MQNAGNQQYKWFFDLEIKKTLNFFIPHATITQIYASLLIRKF